MSIYDELVSCERELDRFEAQLASRVDSPVRIPDRPARDDTVPADVLTVGLVGGTGVGKSSLINSLAGRDVSATSSRRPTTARIIPYVHRARLPLLSELAAVKDDLSEDVTPHEVEALRSIIVFDLPDIDSTRDEHAGVVERALRGLDLVVWVTSLTKYSDREFHEWLARHASDRDVGNAIFVLNKVDEMDEPDPERAIVELVRRFEDGIRVSLGGTGPIVGEPKFYTCSARHPARRIPGNRFGELRDEIFKERSEREIARIKSSDRVALLESRLGDIRRALDLDRRREDLSEAIESVTRELSRIVDLADVKAEMAARIENGSAPERVGARLFKRDLRGWPLLPHLGFLTSPFRPIRRLIVAARLALPTDDAETGRESKERFPVLQERLDAIQRTRRIESSRRPDPIVSASKADGESGLAVRLEELENECVLRAREALASMVDAEEAPRRGRWLRGALIWTPIVWFPFLQPILEELLRPAAAGSIPPRLAYRLVRMFGANHLLVSATFIVLVFLIYVMALRTRAHRRALRECRRLLESEWWRESLLARLVEYLTEQEHAALDELETDAETLRGLDERTGALRASLESGRITGA